MSTGRRTTERRRRVLYSAAADTGPSTAASRRELARLREARCPAETFGSRVHRQLRARWYGLVPVRRRTASILVGSIAAVALLLCAAHYMSVTWPAIAGRGEIARPLRLDRGDSFGGWLIGMLMIGSAAASLLIYQLRRHRLDDFRGHYRLWRTVIIVILLASLNSVVALIDWTGALLDVGLGKRVAFSGADWIRIVISLGGVILAIRLIAEIRHCRTALAAMLSAAGFLAIPEAAKWNVIEVQTIERWALVTSAPLLACTSLFISFGLYLRMLYRQVRRLDETDRLSDRLQRVRLKVLRRSEIEIEDSELEATENDDSEPRRRWWHRKQRLAAETESDEDDSEYDDDSANEVTETDVDLDSNAELDLDTVAPSRPRRRWFGLRAAKTQAIPEDSIDKGDTVETDDDRPAKKKRGRFSMRLKPTPPVNQAKPVSVEQDEATVPEQPKRKFGLGGFRKQRAEAAAEEREDQSVADDRPSNRDDYIDPEQIDWNGLSKAERRRLRKQIKRQNAA